MGGIISAAFYIFCLTFPEDLKPRNSIIITIILIQIIFFPLYFFSNLIIGYSYRVDSLWRWGQFYGPLWFLFDICYLYFWIHGVFILYNKFVRIRDNKLRRKLKYMIIGLLFGFIPPTIFSIVLPRIGYFDLNWLGPVSGSVWVFIIAYSIARYRQMNVRLEATKVFVIAMVMMALLNIFIDFVFGIYGRIALFTAFAILGYILFKSLSKEAAQRAELTSLNTTLSEKVAAQTAEIRKAYEMEKHARRELEKLNETKDQFIMITQHHLRTPVTNLRWQLETMLGGAYGKVSPEFGKALNDTSASVNRLTRIVDDFLNITALKVGSQILNIETGNLKPLVNDVLDELKIDIEDMRLSVRLPEDVASWPDLPIDQSKMREVLLIILENAVKYNMAGGTITIQTSIVDGTHNVDHENTSAQNKSQNHDSDHRDSISNEMFEMTIENTGMGLAREDRANLFTRHFFRSKRAQTANPVGMGIGLSVARAVVRAHHGTLEIESQGEGMGARVRVRVPMLL